MNKNLHVSPHRWIRLERIVGRTFKNETVNLDFSAYERCNFVNCTIHSDYGIFRLVDCDLQNCKLSLGGPAESVARLIQLFFPGRPIHFETRT